MPAPRARNCHICGQRALLNSFEHHVKKCADTFLKREAQKPSKERKKLPRDPMLELEIPKGSRITAAQLEMADSLSMANSSEVCGNCGRSFQGEDRLAIHHRSCTSSNPSKSVRGFKQSTGSGSGNGSGQWNGGMTSGNLREIERERDRERDREFNSPSLHDKYDEQAPDEYATTTLSPCNSCGRTFSLTALAKHSRICGAKAAGGSTGRGTLKGNGKGPRKVFDARKQRLSDLPEAQAQFTRARPKSKSKSFQPAASGGGERGVSFKEPSSNSRLNNTAPSARPGPKAGRTSSSTSSGADSSWREQSNDIRQAMRAARSYAKEQQQQGNDFTVQSGGRGGAMGMGSMGSMGMGGGGGIGMGMGGSMGGGSGPGDSAGVFANVGGSGSGKAGPDRGRGGRGKQGPDRWNGPSMTF